MIKVLIALAGLGSLGAASSQAQKLPRAQDPPAFVVRKATLPVRTLSGPKGGVKALAFSPDDKTLLSAGDKEILLWDTSTGEPRNPLTGHTKGTYAVAISADGRRIASSGEDGTLIVWDAVSGQPIARHTGADYALHNLAFSAQGESVLGSRGAFASLFDSTTGEEAGPLLGHATALASLSWSPDGKFIAVGCLAWPDERPTMAVWEISRKTEAGQWLTFNSNNVRNRKDKSVVAGPRVRLNEHVKYFRDFRESRQQIVVGVCFAADSDLLAVGWGTEVALHSMKTGQDIKSIPILPEASDTRIPLHALALSPNGQLLAVVRANTVQIWNVETARLVAKFLDHNDDVECLAFSHDGKVLATGSADKTIKLWDMTGY